MIEKIDQNIKRVGSLKIKLIVIILVNNNYMY